MILRLSGKVVAATVVIFLLIVFFSSMYIFGWGFFKRSTADFRGETAALEEIYADPNHRITAYQHFFNLCTSIQGHEDTIRALRAELEVGPREDRVEQIQGAITANQAARDRKIREYNNLANQDYIAAQFHAANLPAQLDVTAEATECAT